MIRLTRQPLVRLASLLLAAHMAAPAALACSLADGACGDEGSGTLRLNVFGETVSGPHACACCVDCKCSMSRPELPDELGGAPAAGEAPMRSATTAAPRVEIAPPVVSPPAATHTWHDEVPVVPLPTCTPWGTRAPPLC